MRHEGIRGRYGERRQKGKTKEGTQVVIKSPNFVFAEMIKFIIHIYTHIVL